MPEFNQLLATITLNLFKTLIELKFPGRRKNMNSNYYNKMEYPSINYSLSYYNKLLVHYTNEQLSKQRSYSMYTNDDSSTEYAMLISLLNEISILNITDATKDDYWSYKKIMEIYLTYIAYMSGIFIKNIGFIKTFDDEVKKNIGFIETFDDEKDTATKLCVEYIKYCHQIYINTPFILFPTFVQLNEIKIIRTLSAPIVNFYITYTRTMSHENIIPPCNHISHDIKVHGTITHFHILTQKLPYEKHTPISAFMEAVKKPIDVDITKIYNTLDFLFRNLIANLDSENKENKENKNIISLLFELFHEHIEPIIFIFQDGCENIDLILKNIVNCIMNMNKFRVIEYKKQKELTYLENKIKLNTNISNIESTKTYYEKRIISAKNYYKIQNNFFSAEQQEQLYKFLITKFEKLKEFSITRFDNGFLQLESESESESKPKSALNNKTLNLQHTRTSKYNSFSRGSKKSTHGTNRGSKKHTNSTSRGSKYWPPGRSSASYSRGSKYRPPGRSNSVI